MKTLSRRIFFIPCVILTLGLLVSSGFCTTINDIINESPSADAKGTPGDGSNYFAIQVGVFLDQEDADKQIIGLKSQGLDPYVFQSINSRGQTIYSTRIGRFDTAEEAGAEIARLKERLPAKALITHYDSLTPVQPSGIKTASAKKTDAAIPAPLNSPAARDEAQSSASPPEKNIAPVGNQTLQEKITALESAIQKLQDESEVRKQLTVTEDEATQEEEEDILEAAGQEYTLTQEGNMKFGLGVSYSYSGYDAIKQAYRVEDVADHSISTSLSASYGLKDNFSLGLGIPFVYKYQKVGTVASLETNDLGDLGVNWQVQPFKSGRDAPTLIVNGNFSVPVGRSPYEIAVGEELSTSSGLTSTNIGFSVSQVSDPVVVFSSMSLAYSLPLKDINQKRNEGVLDEVDPGLGLGVGVGMGYALSYKLNLHLSFSYNYSFETSYKYLNAPEANSGVGVSSSMTIGVGYKVSQNQNLNFNIGIPLTTSRSFSFGFSTPLEFEL